MKRYSSDDHACWQKGLALLSVTVVLTIVMQSVQEYRFYAKEVEHLWLNDWLWIGAWLRQPGGMAQLVTSAMTQYFGLWGIGSLTMALCLTLLLACGWNIHQRLRLPHWAEGWWLLPLVFLILCHENGYYNLRGTLATTLAMAMACIYVRWPKPWLSALLPLATYWLAGAAGTLLALAIVAIELSSRRRVWSIVLSPLSAFLSAGFGVRCGVWITMEEALTPAQYYEWPSTYFFPLYAWVSILVLLLTGATRRTATIPSQSDVKPRPSLRWIAPMVSAAASAIIGVALYVGVHNANVYQLRQDEWRASHQDWDGIIASHRGSDRPTPFISYLNLALAQKGQLVARMGEFHPYIMWSDEAQRYSPVLMTQNELSRDALKLQSAVCWAWGGAALCNAQKAAFEANLLTPGMTDPVELQRLILTNLRFDTPLAAQKYLRRLHRTTMHHAWADQMLSDASGLEAALDQVAPVPSDDGFYLKTQVGRLLRQVVAEDPDNRVAAQFYEAYLIQSQDSVAYRYYKMKTDTND